MTTFDPLEYRAFCHAELHAESQSFYATRILQSKARYSERAFYHAVDPNNVTTSTIVLPSKKSVHMWSSTAVNAQVPTCNRELSIASLQSMAYHDLEPRYGGDSLRIIFIKSHKVASSTMSAILARTALARRLDVVPANKHGEFMDKLGPQVEVYDMLLHHNFFNQMGAKGFQFHGGYQPWMDFYVPRAWRLLTASEPMEVCMHSCCGNKVIRDIAYL